MQGQKQSDVNVVDRSRERFFSALQSKNFVIYSLETELSLIKLSVQFSSVAQSYPTPCNPMNCSTSGFPVYHQHPELAQAHVYQVGDATQPSPSPLSPSPDFNLSHHQGLFQRVSSLHQVTKVLEFQLQHQSFQ